MSPFEPQEIEGAGVSLSGGRYLLQGTSSELRFDLNKDGEPFAADEAPTVTVVTDAGDPLVTEGTGAGENGEYSFVLNPAQTAELNLLTATWSVKVDSVVQTFTTHHEVVGGYLTSLAAVKASLPNGAKATAREIEDARTLAEDWLEDECGVAFRPRYARDTLNGGGVPQLLLSRPKVIRIREVSVEGVEAIGYSVDPAGVLYAESFWKEGFQNVVAVYEHGFTQVPSQVARAATLLARLFLVPDPSDYDGRASSISTETAHYTLITPGVREAITAIPEVNVVMTLFDFTGVVG